MNKFSSSLKIKIFFQFCHKLTPNYMIHTRETSRKKKNKPQPSLFKKKGRKSKYKE